MKKVLTIYIALFGAALLFLISANGVNSVQAGNSNNEKVIKFSHKVHAEVSDCATCHSEVGKATSLDVRLLPTKDACKDCHDVEDAEQCQTCHYDGVTEPLVQKKSELIFSHALHIGDNGPECVTCHQGVNEVDYAYKAAGVNPTMQSCYTCHTNLTQATTECTACHVSTANLMPQSHFASNFKRVHGMKSEKECAMCHDQDFCSSCHAGTTGITEGNTAKDFYAPYQPDQYIDNFKKQQLTRVHGLDYRFTHGLDARGKTSECTTCHQPESFCSSCHNAGGGDYALEGVRPSSHDVPSFVFVGAGGGDHARLAKRDLESCMNCHDIQGQDPVCMQCHRVGVK